MSGSEGKQTGCPGFVNPCNPTRMEILRYIAHRNAEGIAVRFSMGELIRAADQAAADGDLVWERRSNWEGRWITEQGEKKLLDVQPTSLEESWKRCHIGSCERHGACQYTPCRVRAGADATAQDAQSECPACLGTEQVSGGFSGMPRKSFRCPVCSGNQPTTQAPTTDELLGKLLNAVEFIHDSLRPYEHHEKVNDILWRVTHALNERAMSERS